MAALTVFARTVKGEALRQVAVVAGGDLIYSGPLIHDPEPAGTVTRLLTSALFRDQDIDTSWVDELTAKELLAGTAPYSALGGRGTLTPLLRSPESVPDPDSAFDRLGYELTLRTGVSLMHQLQALVPPCMDWHQLSWNHWGMWNGVPINGGSGCHMQGAKLSSFELATFGWFAMEAFNRSEWTDWTAWIRESVENSYGWRSIGPGYGWVDEELGFVVFEPTTQFAISRLGDAAPLQAVIDLVEGIRSAKTSVAREQ
jgi:hypothetical protein